jgi:hypothetical protein
VTLHLLVVVVQYSTPTYLVDEEKRREEKRRKEKRIG